MSQLDELLSTVRGRKSQIRDSELQNFADATYKLLEALTENVKELRKETVQLSAQLYELKEK
jgi:hypothetical protein